MKAKDMKFPLTVTEMAPGWFKITDATETDVTAFDTQSVNAEPADNEACVREIIERANRP